MVPSLKGEVWPRPGCIYPEEGGPALIEEVSSCMWEAWPCLRTPNLSGVTQCVLGHLVQRGSTALFWGVHLKGRW